VARPGSTVPGGAKPEKCGLTTCRGSHWGVGCITNQVVGKGGVLGIQILCPAFFESLGGILERVPSGETPTRTWATMMLKSPDIVGLSWPTRLLSVAWRLGTVPVERQTGALDRRLCSDYRRITLLSLPKNVYSRVLEKRLRPIVEPQRWNNVDSERLTSSLPLQGYWGSAPPSLRPVPVATATACRKTVECSLRVGSELLSSSKIV